MTAAEAVGPGPTPAGRSPGTVLARSTAKRAARSGALWGYVFGVFVAGSALTYSSFYRTAADRERLAAAFGSNKASAALFGPAPHLQTVAGFTVLKTSMTLMVLGAVFGLLTSTRLLRGEEDAGRFDLFVAGQTNRGRATAEALAGLGAGALVLYVVAAAITIVVGRSSKVHVSAAAAAYFALALVATAVVFLAVGALTSQLAGTRRRAAAYAAVVLGVSYAVRLVADAGVGLHGLVWASPLGWVEQLRPLDDPRPLALVPLAATTTALAAGAVLVARRRDLGAGLFPDRSTSPPRLGLLFGPTGLAMRTLRPVVLGWWVAIAVTGLLTGLVAKAAGATIAGSSVRQVFTRLGAPGAGARAFLGVSFLIVAVLVACAAAGQVTSARAEESSGRLDHLLVRPLARTSWLGGRFALALGVLVASGVVAGVFAWLAAAAEGSGLGLGSLVDAGLNVVPPAVALLGIGVLTLGVWPRATSAVVYAVLGWSLLVVVVGGVGTTSRYLLDTSLFHHMAAAPAVAPNWQANVVLVAIGLVAAALGAAALARRDLAGD